MANHLHKNWASIIFKATLIYIAIYWIDIYWHLDILRYWFFVSFSVALDIYKRSSIYFFFFFPQACEAIPSSSGGIQNLIDKYTIKMSKSQLYIEAGEIPPCYQVSNAMQCNGKSVTTAQTLPEAQRTQKLTPWLGLNLATTWHHLHKL